MTHVAVLMGGWSSEREVSLNSGKACVRALESVGYRVTPVDVDRNIGSTLASVRPDVAFNALHGPYGEDGTIQGILEVLGIPYTHSGVLSSALAMNKQFAKIVMAASGIPVPEGRTVSRAEAAEAHVLEPPYVLKPVAEGSSYGVFIVPEGQAHPPQELTRHDWSHGETLLAEKFVAGRELTCAAMGDRALGVIDIRAADGGWYDYNAKYSKGGSIHILPAQIKGNIYQRIQELTVAAHKALGCRGVSRADFRYDDRPDGTGELVVLEVNTQPGMTPLSLVPEQARHRGMNYAALVQRIVEEAL